MTANSGDLFTELTRDSLPASSMSVFITGFVSTEEVQTNKLFKYIKVIVNEFTGKGSTGNKFNIKCRYLQTDIRIDKKVNKTKKNSNVMITGELVTTNSEFQIDIQDLNFLPMSMANIEVTTTSDGSASSSYTWSATAISSGRLSAQAMADTSINTSNTPQLTNDQTDDDADDRDNNEIVTDTSTNIQTTRRKRTRKV